MVFSILPKIGLVFFLVKFNLFFFNTFNSFFFGYIYLVCGFFSLIYGILTAMFQYNIKRFLAYGSIVNIGLILIGFSTMTFNGLFGVLYFLICYLFVLSLLFYFLINIRKDDYKELFFMSELGEYIYSNSFISFIVCIIFLSFIGVPPLMGFFGKFFLLFSIFIDHYSYIYFLVFFLTLFSSFYYLRVIRYLYFTKLKKKFSLYIYDNKFIQLIFIIILYFFFFFDFFGQFLYLIILTAFF